jgi:hypothetical protein
LAVIWPDWLDYRHICHLAQCAVERGTSLSRLRLRYCVVQSGATGRRGLLRLVAKQQVPHPPGESGGFGMTSACSFFCWLRVQQLRSPQLLTADSPPQPPTAASHGSPPRTPHRRISLELFKTGSCTGWTSNRFRMWRCASRLWCGGRAVLCTGWKRSP